MAAAQPAGMQARIALTCADDGEPCGFPVATQAALIRDMIAGSERAWRAFHAAYDRLICGCIARVATKFAAFVREDDIREMHSTFLMQIISHDMIKLRSFDPARGTRFGTWVGLLAVNCAYDYLRALRREPERALIAEYEALLTDDPTPHEHLEQKERLAMAAAALGELTAKDREFASLYFGEGLHPKQIAQRMQITLKTVYSRKNKIQHRLAAIVSEALCSEDQLAA
jgi:RNA polymerase sigma-70 factor, ECF subfamily